MRNNRTSRIRNKHHGLAMLLVLLLVGTAAVLSMAMLQASAMQAQSAANAGRAAGADYLANSSIELAQYFLQYPSYAPPTWTSQAGYKLYARGIVIPGMAGSFDLDAAATTRPDVYAVHAVGYSASGGLSRTSTATVKLIRSVPTFSAGFGNPTILFAPSKYTFTPAFPTGITSYLLPTATGTLSINYYGGNSPTGSYTMPDGRTGKPDAIGATLAAAPVASAGNPGQVFYSASSLAITNPMTINGTLIVRGDLDVRAGGTVTLTRTPGFPALIADGRLDSSRNDTKFTANGVVWLGTGTAVSSNNTTMTINGSLLMPILGTLGAIIKPGASMAVNYNSTYTDVINLTSTPQSIVSVKTESWVQ